MYSALSPVLKIRLNVNLVTSLHICAGRPSDCARKPSDDESAGKSAGGGVGGVRSSESASGSIMITSCPWLGVGLGLGSG